MSTDIISQRSEKFENIRHHHADGHEYWLASELSQLLEYPDYPTFQIVIERAKQACSNSGRPVGHHFEVIEPAKEGVSQKGDMKLSRYACYLILQNGDPAKPAMAQEQTYFAVQTRKQELAAKKGVVIPQLLHRITFNFLEKVRSGTVNAYPDESPIFARTSTLVLVNHSTAMSWACGGGSFKGLSINWSHGYYNWQKKSTTGVCVALAWKDQVIEGQGE